MQESARLRGVLHALHEGIPIIRSVILHVLRKDGVLSQRGKDLSGHRCRKRVELAFNNPRPLGVRSRQADHTVAADQVECPQDGNLLTSHDLGSAVGGRALHAGYNPRTCTCEGDLNHAVRQTDGRCGTGYISGFHPSAAAAYHATKNHSRLAFRKPLLHFFPQYIRKLAMTYTQQAHSARTALHDEPCSIEAVRAEVARAPVHRDHVMNLFACTPLLNQMRGTFFHCTSALHLMRRVC